MIKNEYFPTEVNWLEDEKVDALIRSMGAEGIGIYQIILVQLRRRNNYCCGIEAIKRMGRMYYIEPEKIEQVTGGFGLFHIEGEGDARIVSSHYLNRVMTSLEEKRKALVATGKKSGRVRREQKNEPGSNLVRTEEKSKEEKSREDTAGAVEEKTAAPTAIPILQEKIEDTSPPIPDSLPLRSGHPHRKGALPAIARVYPPKEPLLLQEDRPRERSTLLFRYEDSVLRPAPT